MYQSMGLSGEAERGTTNIIERGRLGYTHKTQLALERAGEDNHNPFNVDHHAQDHQSSLRGSYPGFDQTKAQPHQQKGVETAAQGGRCLGRVRVLRAKKGGPR